MSKTRTVTEAEDSATLDDRLADTTLPGGRGPVTTPEAAALPQALPAPAPAPAAGGDPVASLKEDDRIRVVVALKPRHHDYLCARAALHGETPERHLETILRVFQAHHDDKRHDMLRRPAEPGAGPVVSRVA